MIVARTGRRVAQMRWAPAASASSPWLPSPAPTEALFASPHRRPFLGVVSGLFIKPAGYGVERNRQDGRRLFSSEALADDVAAGGCFTTVDVPLAQTGEGIAECELLRWYVQEGDQVEEFQPLCEVQSDKATIEITSRYKGKVSEVLHVPGNIVKVGETLLKMVVEGSESEAPIQSQAPIQNSSENTQSLDQALETNESEGVLSTPAVRHLAKEYGIDLKHVCGSGKDGRVLKDDVVKFAINKGLIKDSAFHLSTGSMERTLGDEEKSQGESLAAGRSHDDMTIPLRGFQRAMVKTMTMAAKVPHFHYVEEINCDALAKLKAAFQSYNSDPNIKYTFLPILIKSLSMALSKYPWMNSCFHEESLEVIVKGSHNIGIAMATPHGLVVPNIKNVQSLSISQITREMSRLQTLASENKLSPEDVAGGTITLSNIGAIGGKFGSPLLNLPEAAIIAMGRIQKVAQFDDSGNIHPSSVMTVNIGADHRVLDGATVARFCNEWKRCVENPELLMLEMR